MESVNIYTIKRVSPRTLAPHSDPLGLTEPITL